MAERQRERNMQTETRCSRAVPMLGGAGKHGVTLVGAEAPPWRKREIPVWDEDVGPSKGKVRGTKDAGGRVSPPALKGGRGREHVGSWAGKPWGGEAQTSLEGRRPGRRTVVDMTGACKLGRGVLERKDMQEGRKEVIGRIGMRRGTVICRITEEGKVGKGL